MGLKKLQTKKLKKKTIRARARTGLAGVPIEKGFEAVKDYFHLEVDKKDCFDIAFISNGEPFEDTNFKILKEHLEKNNLSNRLYLNILLNCSGIKSLNIL